MVVVVLVVMAVVAVVLVVTMVMVMMGRVGSLEARCSSSEKKIFVCFSHNHQFRS